MTTILTTLCGKTKNRHGKPFGAQGFRHHRQNCPECIQIGGRVQEEELDDDDDTGMPDVMNDLDLSDESDGVFLGLWNELS